MNDHCRPLLAELVSATNAYASFTHERERMIAQAFAGRYAFDRNVRTAISMFAIVAAFRVPFGERAQSSASPDAAGARGLRACRMPVTSRRTNACRKENRSARDVHVNAHA
ncbi:hypothetical protein WK43_15680 [Burkholderia ubonensis]|nr:hypothetical protein WK38_31250 [Burkholderia ubonensis]KVS44619.1 hypothetical protein WK37_14950 [Burkholderia ubonensis]KVS76791.1 hypothetical protein WK42_02945 [Burkholderia ubonensis]KVS90090.1 hypothetical protein WK44_18385 [Burkholderia ubonensis]KVS91205.1 hypothetical protein WK43_15680 [Burkholderia ubonensis]